MQNKVTRIFSTVRRWSGVCLTVCVGMVPFALGTSPIPAPYHRYVVNGTVTRSNGSPAPDVIVVLLSRTIRDSILQLPRSNGTREEQPLSVTYQGGGFTVSVELFTKAESLALGFIPNGRPMVQSPAFHPDPALSFEVKSTGTSNVETGCSGCGTEQSKYEYVSAYRTSISQSYTLPE
jgi:hypothetical protein